MTAMVEEKINLMIKDLNKHKKSLLNDIGGKYSKFTNECKFLMENGMNLKEEATTAQQNYQNMFNTNVDDGEARETYLSKKYNEMTKQLNKIKSSLNASNADTHKIDCQYNDTIGNNIRNVELKELFSINSLYLQDDQFMTLDGTIIQGNKFDYIHDQMRYAYHIIGVRSISRKYYKTYCWTIGVFDETNGDLVKQKLIKNGAILCKLSKAVVAGTVRGNWGGGAFGEEKESLSCKITPGGKSKITLDFDENVIRFEFYDNGNKITGCETFQISKSMTVFRFVAEFARRDATMTFRKSEINFSHQVA